MGLFDKIFKKEEKEYTNHDIVLEIINYLSNQITDNTYKVNLQLRIVNEKPSRSCTITDIDKFKERMNTIDGTVSYELLIRWITDNPSNMNMIQTKIDLMSNNVTIKYENNDNLNFINTKVDEIKKIIENMKVIPTIEEKIKVEPKVELISLGILGNYDIYEIEYKTNQEITKEQEYQKIKEVINGFTNNIDKINNNLFYEIHSNLDCVVGNLWEEESFSKIIDIDKLPQEYENATDEEKHAILFDFSKEITKDNIIEITNQEKPFWNINNIKNDLRIKNVIIEEEYNKLMIEFDGILNSFIAYLEIDYSNNYEITNFDPC